METDPAERGYEGARESEGCSHNDKTGNIAGRKVSSPDLQRVYTLVVQDLRLDPLNTDRLNTR